MKHDLELKLQAWVDGELPAAEAADVARRVGEDPEAARLAAELKRTRALVAANELEHPVPATREFYWAQIERQLNALDQRAADPRPAAVFGWRQWLRRLAPAAALAGIVIVALTTALESSKARRNLASGTPTIETPLEDLGSFTFRSESAQMTVVWVSAF